MAIGLSSSQRKKPKKFWGANHLLDSHRPLPRSLRYNVESLEPRYLLSGVALSNASNDGTKAVDNKYIAVVSSQVQSVVGQLSYLGQQIDKNSITSQTAIPLLNKSVNDLSNL